MTDWIEHKAGAPQPVADDVWVMTPAPDMQTFVVQLAKSVPWRFTSGCFRIINQHLIDAALERGIRLGLEAAATTVCRREIEAARELEQSGDCHSPAEGRLAGLAEATDLIHALNPDTIAKEAQHD